jgi:exosortase H (IPTLxxWG-CTERM-specific)
VADGPPPGRSGTGSAIGIAYIKFGALLLGLFTLSQTSLADRLVFEPVARGIARIASGLLGLFSINAQADGAIIRTESFAALVDTNCTGLFVIFIYLSALLAYRSGTREKLIGVALGFGALFVLNLVRVVSLVVVGAVRPDMLNVAHYLVWQSVMIVAALCLWLFWAERVADAPGH